MVVLKIIGKMLLVPVWILVAMICLLVKTVVAVYSFTRGFAALGLGALIMGTAICYQDWRQVILLICISVISILFLFIGTLIEACLEKVRKVIGKAFLS